MNDSIATHSIVRASAGTGKTFELSSRYIKLLLKGAHPKTILATTFTRKAAGEILDRIVERLAMAAQTDEQAVKTSHELEIDTLSKEQFADVLGHLIKHLNNLQVETLDAFFFKIASAFSLDIGMPPGWEIADQAEMASISDRAIQQSLSRANAATIMHDLAKGEAKRGIHSMMQTTVKDVYEIYRETFDQNRLDAWSQLQKMEVLNAEAIEILCLEIENLDYDASDSFKSKITAGLEKIRNQQWADLLKSGPFAKCAIGQETFGRFQMPTELLQLMQKIVLHAIGLQINILVDQTQGAYRFIETFHKEFDGLKKELGRLEFNDVSYLTSLLFSNYEFERLSWRLDQKIDHLLLDEFQDTSIQQWEVLRPLAKRVCKTNTDRSFFCVGDVKQAIYGWRGGVAEIFDEVQQEFSQQIENPETRSKSYRSSPAVINTVNEVFLNIDRAEGYPEEVGMIRSWQKGFKEHLTEHQQRPGYACFATSSDKDQHHAEVAERVSEIARQHPNRTIGILTRTNKEVANHIFALGNAGIHASEEGGNPLTDSAGVNLLLSGLKLLDHPDDSLARFHLLHSPLASTFALNPENFAVKSDSITEALLKLRYQMVSDGYGPMLSDWSKVLEPFCTAREWFRIGQLVSKSYSISTADHIRTTELIRWVETQKVADPTAAPVSVMTFHKSKGLEFDIVILPDLDFGRGQDPSYVVGRASPTQPIDLVCRFMDKAKRSHLPLQFQRAFDAQLEGEIHEMLCTMYVALTRAKHAIHMIAKPNQYSGRKSAAGMIMSALKLDYIGSKDTRAGEVLWETKHGNWDTEEEVVEATTSEPKPLGKIKFAAPTANRNLPWESPSGREGNQTFSLGKLLQQEDNRDARLFGSLIHACFEQIEWLEDGTPGIELLKEKLTLVESATPNQIQDAIEKFQKFIKQPNTASLLKRQQYQIDLFHSYDELKVDNERAFEVHLGNSILNGFIDRLVLLVKNGKVTGADIIDFKTDSISLDSADHLTQKIEVYKPQIRSYRDAVSAIYDLNPQDVSARLLFVTIDRQVPIG